MRSTQASVPTGETASTIVEPDQPAAAARAVADDAARRTWRVKAAVTAGGLASFVLLSAPQAVLPQIAQDFRLDPGRVSLVVSLATIALALTALPIATLSEIVGRRRVIVVSVAATAVLGLLLPLAPSFSALLAMRVLQGVAIAGFAGVSAPYLVEELGQRGVTAAVGAMIAGNSIGGMSGRLLAGFLTDRFGWHGALTAVAAVSAVFTAITVLALPPRRAAQRAAQPSAADLDGRDHGRDGGRHAAPRGAPLAGVLAGIGAGLRRPVLLAQYSVALLGMGSFFALYNVASFRLTGPSLHLPAAVASLVFLTYSLGSVSSALAGRMVARAGRAPVLLGMLAATALGAALTVPDSVPFVALGFALFTTGFFGAHTVANAWAASAAPADARGQVGGLYMLFYHLGSSVGGTIGSMVYGAAGWSWLIALTATWLLLAMGSVSAVAAGARRHAVAAA